MPTSPFGEVMHMMRSLLNPPNIEASKQGQPSEAGGICQKAHLVTVMNTWISAQHTSYPLVDPKYRQERSGAAPIR